MLEYSPNCSIENSNFKLTNRPLNYQLLIYYYITLTRREGRQNREQNVGRVTASSYGPWVELIKSRYGLCYGYVHHLKRLHLNLLHPILRKFQSVTVRAPTDRPYWFQSFIFLVLYDRRPVSDCGTAMDAVCLANLGATVDIGWYNETAYLVY